MSNASTTSTETSTIDEPVRGTVHGIGGPPSDGPSGGRGPLLKWFVILFVVFAVLALYSSSQKRASHRVLAQQTDRMAVPYVALVHATPLSGESDLVLPGNIQSYVDSPIYARTNGYLKKWYKDIGSQVSKGDLLADIDTPEVDAQLAQAKADLATAQANVKLAGITAQRYQDLLKSDSVSKQDVDNYNGDYAAKQAMVQSAAANLQRLEELESFKRVYAPFSGVITKRNVDIGTLINAGNGGTSVREMFDLAQTDPLRVYVAVPQTNVSSIHDGMKACLELTEFPGRNFCGKVVRTAGAVDPSTRTLLTEVDVPNPSKTLLEGEYAQVHFDAKLTGEHLSVPNNALLFRPNGTMVAVVGPDNKIDLKKLTIGRDLGASVEVLEGITSKDAFVINPPDSLDQGEQVKISPASGSQGS
ncbi:MAG TPA: efflux RND transporter periplasmic adaptor subunit [Candidatus Acidoferrales bacterium]|nr:efflux RND transporter periplasmic adaptor subunit [Candidatus Acidoferrales bacterium]